MDSGSIFAAMDGVLIVTQIFSMLAAFAAVVFAYATVLETRALRREERIARLLELVAEVGETGTRAARGQAGENLLTVARQRVAGRGHGCG
jgi:type II secretory pathway component PulJ